MTEGQVPVVALAAQSVLDALPASAAVLDADGRIVQVNRRWLRFCIDNAGRPEAVSPPADYLAASTDEVADGIRAVLTGQADHFETEYPCHGPTIERWFRMIATPLAGGALIVHLDITGEYERISRWLSTTPTAIIELDSNLQAVFVNHAWAQHMGVPRRSLLGPEWAGQLAEDDRQRLTDAVRTSTIDGVDRTVDVTVPGSEGDIWMRFQISAHLDDDGLLRRMSLVGMDVTAARRLNNQLAAAAERQRIAADLHDVVLQDLIATGLALENARMRGSAGPELLAQVTLGIERSIADLRKLGVQLPGQSRGVTDVDTVIRQATLALGFSPDVVIDADLERLDDTTSFNLVAVLNEALSNVARHAHATYVSVKISEDVTGLVLTVRDNGVGMPSTPARRSGTGHIARRATEHGGTAVWSPNPGGGTVLSWRVPVPSRSGRSVTS